MSLPCKDCNESKTVAVCGKCRMITKSDLVEMLLDNDNPPYLDKYNRHETGRKRIHTGMRRRSIAYQHHIGRSYRELANENKISHMSVKRYYEEYRKYWE
jgi:hypothetical protein